MNHTVKAALASLILAVGCSTDKSSNAPAPAPAPTAAAPAPVTTTQAAPAPAAPVVTTPVVATPVAETPVVVTTPAPVTSPADGTTDTTATPAAPSTAVLAILSVNGLQVDSSGSTTVHPGDSVTLVADALSIPAGCAAEACAERENLGVDQLTWSADDRATDTCAAAESALCARTSNFALSGNGVTFLVPRDQRGDVKITVRQTGTALLTTFVLQLDRTAATTPGGREGQGDHQPTTPGAPTIVINNGHGSGR